MEVQLEDGSSYFFHLNNLDGSWDRPQDFVHNSVFLERKEIQVRHLRDRGLCYVLGLEDLSHTVIFSGPLPNTTSDVFDVRV